MRPPLHAPDPLCAILLAHCRPPKRPANDAMRIAFGRYIATPVLWIAEATAAPAHGRAGGI